MRLCYVSHSPSTPGAAVERDRPHTIVPALLALAQVGHDVSWLTSLCGCAARDSVLSQLAPADTALPPTCRYVLPCQAYTLAGVRVIDIEAALWQQAALHTRLFTFLRLFQHAVACDVWHVRGALPLVYLVVYTGRLLSVPVIVSYHAGMLHDSAQQPFLWEWLRQHVRHLVVTHRLEPQLPCPAHIFPQAYIHALAYMAPQASPALAAVYARATRSLSL